MDLDLGFKVLLFRVSRVENYIIVFGLQLLDIMGVIPIYDYVGVEGFTVRALVESPLKLMLQ